MKKNYKIVKVLFALVLGIFISAFSIGAHTVQASETTQNTVEVKSDTAAESSDNAGSVVMLLMGGMLIIIIAVVLSVVASVVSTVAAVDED